MSSTLLRTAGTVEVDSEAIYREEFLVPRDAVDANGHVNNVVYLRWMQDVAIRHSDAAGVTAAMQALDATWVVRSHHVEYLTPAFADDRIAVSTWVVHFRRVRSLRRYWFVNASTGKVLVRGETDWVFVDRASGRPRSVPADIIRRFPILTDDAGF